jgi:hypothetical protein
VKQSPRRKALIISTVILLVLIGGATFVSYRWWDYPFASAQLDKEWERAQKNGIPLSAEELNPRTSVRARDNAAIPYEKAVVKIWQAEYKARSIPQPSTEGLTREQFEWQRDTAILSLVGPYLDLVEEGAVKPEYWCG